MLGQNDPTYFPYNQNAIKNGPHKPDNITNFVSFLTSKTDWITEKAFEINGGHAIG